jgi:2-polyprenyl-3-methyl-5-hydroxy-6-metoxy-1,4-benzoquinol methylase
MLEALLLIIAFLATNLPIPDSSKVLLSFGVLCLVIPGIIASIGGAPFVPTNRRIKNVMLGWAKIKPGEKVFDVGCGEGQFVFAAAKLGANAIGYELSLPVFMVARLRAVFHPGSTIELKDFWKQDYRGADVIFCFLLKETMQDFKRIIWPQLKPGCRVVSHAFSMKGIEPKERDRDAMMYVKGE